MFFKYLVYNQNTRKNKSLFTFNNIFTKLKLYTHKTFLIGYGKKKTPYLFLNSYGIQNYDLNYSLLSYFYRLQKLYKNSLSNNLPPFKTILGKNFTFPNFLLQKFSKGLKRKPFPTFFPICIQQREEKKSNTSFGFFNTHNFYKNYLFFIKPNKRNLLIKKKIPFKTFFYYLRINYFKTSVVNYLSLSTLKLFPKNPFWLGKSPLRVPNFKSPLGLPMFLSFKNLKNLFSKSFKFTEKLKQTSIIF